MIALHIDTGRNFLTNPINSVLSMGSAAPPGPEALPPTGYLEPSWRGFIFSTRDALTIFEACLRGTLHAVPRRPHDRERANLIQSGSVFVYMETDSGIKRWTDGIPWSPSRILGNFLIYRELEKAFGPGEKKRALKHGNKRASRPGEQESMGHTLPRSPSVQDASVNEYPLDRNNQRALIGSLTDSYAFREGGLVKKTITVRYENINYHLVSYYTVSDVQAFVLKRPSETGQAFPPPRRELWEGQNFRSSEGIESFDTLPSPYSSLQANFSPFNYRSNVPFSTPPITTPTASDYTHNAAGAPIFRTASHNEHLNTSNDFSLMSSHSSPADYQRNLDAHPHVMTKNETQSFSPISHYDTSDVYIKDTSSNYQFSLDHSQHSPDNLSLQYTTGRMPMSAAPRLHHYAQAQFSQNLAKQDQVLFTRPEDMRSELNPHWPSVVQPEGLQFQDEQSWAAASRSFPGNYQKDSQDNTPGGWHSQQR